MAIEMKITPIHDKALQGKFCGVNRRVEITPLHDMALQGKFCGVERTLTKLR